jgi:hypothetical protein
MPRILRKYAAPAAGAAAIIVTGIVVWQSIKHSDGPSASDTLAWMDSTYNDHGAAGGSGGYGINEDDDPGTGFPIRKTIQSFTYDGCNITIQFDDLDFDHASIGIETKGTHTFNLGDIDPASITTSTADSENAGMSCDLAVVNGHCDEAVIQFETRNRQPVIRTASKTIYAKLRGRDHENAGTSTGYSSAWFVGDVEYAKRFETAFRHAVALCGGMRSTF